MLPGRAARARRGRLRLAWHPALPAPVCVKCFHRDGQTLVMVRLQAQACTLTVPNHHIQPPPPCCCFLAAAPASTAHTAPRTPTSASPATLTISPPTSPARASARRPRPGDAPTLPVSVQLRGEGEAWSNALPICQQALGGCCSIADALASSLSPFSPSRLPSCPAAPALQGTASACSASTAGPCATASAWCDIACSAAGQPAHTLHALRWHMYRWTAAYLWLEGAPLQFAIHFCTACFMSVGILSAGLPELCKALQAEALGKNARVLAHTQASRTRLAWDREHESSVVKCAVIQLQH